MPSSHNASIYGVVIVYPETFLHDLHLVRCSVLGRSDRLVHMLLHVLGVAGRSAPLALVLEAFERRAEVECCGLQ